ncbi:hypothetical protein ACVOMV_34075 [Mesorhizobium atlanticum]
MSIDNPAPRLSGFGLADWLCLAAAPTFAMMALLDGCLWRPRHDVHVGRLGAQRDGADVPLMAAFHLAPWLRLVARPG